METQFRAILRPQTVLATPRILALAVIFGGAIYGLTMGAYALFSGGGTEKALAQMLFSAIKVPLLLGVTALLCWPTVRVLYSLWGVSKGFDAALSALLSGQAALAIVLASLSPLTLVFYASNLSYRGALLLNAALFFAAALAAQNLIRQRLRVLLQTDPRHKILLKIWFGLFCFVGLQLGWNLRPFIGDPASPAQFFRPDGWTNAYLVIWKMITG